MKENRLWFGGAVRPTYRLRRQHLEHRIAFKEISWSELESSTQCWHHRKIFLARGMVIP